MTAPTVLMEMYLAGAWRDITAYVHLPSGISVTRGRDNEQGSPNPGTLSFTVKADAGRFIIGNTAAPAPFGDFKRWTPVRYSINGVMRFTGYVSSAPVTWRSSQLSQVPIVCTDLLGMMAMSPTIQSWAAELIGGAGPLYWWQMDEPQGADAAYEASLSGPRLDAVVSNPGTDPDRVPLASDVVQFGVAGVDGLESDTQVQFVATDAGGKGGLSASAPLGALPTNSTGITILAIFTKPTFDAAVHWHLSAPGDAAAFRLYAEGSWLELNEYGDDERTDTLDGVLTAGRPFLAAVTLTATQFGFVGRTPRTRDFVAAGQSYSGATLTVSGNGEACISHLAIIPGVMAAATLAELKAKLTGEGVGAVTTWLARACAAVGISAAPTATYDRTMERPALKGSNPAAIAETLAQAANSMCLASRDGVLTWIDWTYCPPVVDLVEPLTDAAKWDADASLYYTDVQVDGNLKAVSPTNTFPKRALSVPGLLPDPEQGSLVAWLANTADVWAAPRVSGIAVSLWALDASRVAAYLGLDIKSRVRLTTLPEGMPPQMIATVEGYTEMVSDTAWTMALNTAPDPRFVLGTSPAGVLGSNYRLL